MNAAEQQRFRVKILHIGKVVGAANAIERILTQRGLVTTRIRVPHKYINGHRVLTATCFWRRGAALCYTLMFTQSCAYAGVSGECAFSAFPFDLSTDHNAFCAGVAGFIAWIFGV